MLLTSMVNTFCVKVSNASSRITKSAPREAKELDAVSQELDIMGHELLTTTEFSTATRDSTTSSSQPLQTCSDPPRAFRRPNPYPFWARRTSSRRTDSGYWPIRLSRRLE